MIVHDRSGRIEDQRTLHHLARIRRRMIDRATLLHFVGNEG